MKGEISLSRLHGLILIGAVLMAILGGITGCSSAATPNPASSTNPEVAAIRAYADPATQTTLQGLSENDLAKYTQNANAQFKGAVTREILDKTATQITNQIGTFESITFIRTENSDGYVIVHYQAKFSKGVAGVRMVFDKDHLVAGQWFE
jgi:hypothetical protein